MDDIETGMVDTCLFCNERIVEIIDPHSRITDWHVDGDFGCGDDPRSDENGTWGHTPREEARGSYVLPTFAANPATDHTLILYFEDTAERDAALRALENMRQ